ncbi:MAG TPA: hypothetical protein VGM91_13135 [Conexibacter sp.]
MGVALLLVAGCGSSSDYANERRPPRPRNIAVSVTDGRIGVAPGEIGAGPVVLIVTNQSERSRDLRLAAPSGSGTACVDADTSSGPINPMGTARVSVTLVQGACVLTTGSASGPRPATLRVGPERPSAQADLMQP